MPLKTLMTFALAGALILSGGVAHAAEPGGSGSSGADGRATAYARAVADAEARSGLVRSPKAAEAEPQPATEDGTPRLRAAAAYTVDASKFAAGDLMSDAVFFKGTALSAAKVQSFLEAQMPKCRANHTCLRAFSAPTADRPADDMCAGYTDSGTQTAAAIIAAVGASCGINQGVLLALLQKEQGLVTDDWPSQTQYDYATGYACPDDPGVGCDPDTKGFFEQVYGAAWQLKRYGNPGSTDDYFTWYPVGRVSQIQYSSNAKLKCGSAPVAIWNKATAALYYYTPYQPNAAALKDFFGTGDACSEYGNRNFWGLYTQWFGDPAAGTVPAATRQAGPDRYATAVAISKASFPSAGVPVVYIASGANFPDALSAVPAAGKNGGPLLMTQPNAIPAVVAAELKRLQPAKIVVVGGVGAISAAVYKQLSAYAPARSRMDGPDRYVVSRALVTGTWSSAPTVYIATGRDFPDALSAGAIAGAASAPVLLVDGTKAAPDAATLALLAKLGVKNVKIAGGPGAVSSGIEKALAARYAVQRLTGPDRFVVSVAINASVTSAPSVYLANGLTFPDALAGAAAAAASKSPLYVVRPGCVIPGAANGALGVGARRIVLLGSAAVLGAEVGKLTVCR